MFNKEKIAYPLSWFIFLIVIIQTTQTLAAFTDLPPPPKRPERFNSREELKQYLQLVHEYYAIIGRPRFGRSYVDQSPFLDQHLYRSFGENSDESLLNDENPLQLFE